MLSTPDATLPAPGSNSHTLSSKDIFRKLTFSEQESLSSSIHFQEPRLEEQYLESVSFSFTETQPNTVSSSSALVYQPLPLSVVSPHSSTPTTGTHIPTTQGAVNQGINMAAPAFLMNRYAPLNLPQPMNAMPQ